MKFVQEPSLQHIALVKIVVSLWNVKDVRAFLPYLSKFKLYCKDEKWKRIEQKVIMKVPQLSLPRLLKEKVLSLIKPIGLQILEWVKFHSRLKLPAKLCWTPQGTIDRLKTTKVLVKDENLDPSSRYKLACIYCLEDNILELWNSMSEKLKKSVSNYSHMTNFWSHNMMRRGLDNPHTSYVSEFNYSVRSSNKVAADYFLKKLTPTERKICLVKSAEYVKHADTLCFLLSEMDEQQQMEAFKNNPFQVLECFLEWPFQGFLIEIANSIWNFLSEEMCCLLYTDFFSLLRNIVNKVTDGHKDWNYQELFREFWQKSSDALKSYITEMFYRTDLVVCLIGNKDKENIRIILKDATLSEKSNVIYGFVMNPYLKGFIRDNDWDFLELFIRECLPSKNKMLKFKEVFEKRSRVRGILEGNKQKWEELFHFSDDSVCKSGKRSAEGESSSSKRIRRL